MKITILQSNFAKALNQVGRIVSARTTLPVLANILISAKKGKIRFSATDLEIGITTQAIGKVDEEGEITLPARLLSDFILNNNEESIVLSVKETKANLKSERFEANISGILAEEFPTLPEIAEETFCQIKREDVIESLRKVAIAPATDETRPVLAGIYFQFEDENLVLAATDSYRLAEKKLKLAKSVEAKKILVPGRTVNEVLRLAAGLSKEEDISILAADNQISFKLGGTTIVSRVIEGAFPAYSQIIPESFKMTAEMALSELQSAVKMSSYFAKDSANNNIKVVLSEKEVVIASVTSQAGDASSKVAAEVSGGEIEIAFNARYVMDVLQVLSGEKVLMKFNDAASSGVITDPKEKDYVYIIMPLKLDN